MYIFNDDFASSTLSADYTNETSAVSVSATAAYSGANGMLQVADGVNAGIASLADSLLPDGLTYAFVAFKFRQTAHSSGNSPILTIQNRTGSDHFDLYVDYGTDSAIRWDMLGTDDANASVIELNKWYDVKVIVFFGATLWFADVWIDGVRQERINTTKTASDVRAIHFGGFGTDVNTRHYDQITVFLMNADPRTVMAFQNLSTEDLLRLFLLKFITATDVTEYETTTADVLGKLVDTDGSVLNVNDVVP